MKIFEVDVGGVDPDAVVTPNSSELMGLVSFLNGRATDTGARKEISQDAFINVAQDLGINITKQDLPQLTNQAPLSNLLEPLQPDSDNPIVYKGGENPDVSMNVNQAQNIVAGAAKSAMKKDRGV
jgi:hypothetical protein